MKRVKPMNYGISNISEYQSELRHSRTYIVHLSALLPCIYPFSPLHITPPVSCSLVYTPLHLCIPITMFSRIRPRAPLPLLRGGIRPYTYLTPRPKPSQTKYLLTILATASTTLLLSQLYQRSEFKLLPTIYAESAASAPSKEFDKTVGKGFDHRFADQETVQMVIKLLKGKLGEDKVTDGDDERLGHGQSPNTYHRKFLLQSLIFLCSWLPDTSGRDMLAN
jgi:hypothetical protein